MKRWSLSRFKLTGLMIFFSNRLEDLASCRLADFGLARVWVGTSAGQQRPGIVAGSGRYIAPEVLRGRARLLKALQAVAPRTIFKTLKD